MLILVSSYAASRRPGWRRWAEEDSQRSLRSCVRTCTAFPAAMSRARTASLPHTACAGKAGEHCLSPFSPPRNQDASLCTSASPPALLARVGSTKARAGDPGPGSPPEHASPVYDPRILPGCSCSYLGAPSPLLPPPSGRWLPAPSFVVCSHSQISSRFLLSHCPQWSLAKHSSVSSALRPPKHSAGTQRPSSRSLLSLRGDRRQAGECKELEVGSGGAEAACTVGRSAERSLVPLTFQAMLRPHQTSPRLSPGTRLRGCLRRVPLSGPSQALSPPCVSAASRPQPSRSSPPAPLPCQPVLPSTHSIPRGPRAATPWPPRHTWHLSQTETPLGAGTAEGGQAREPGACACTAASSPTS